MCVVCYSQACQLLTDIIWFVASQENTAGDPFDVQLTHPDRERQKLLREQNVLKEVRALRKDMTWLKVRGEGHTRSSCCETYQSIQGTLSTH